ncbi:MAG: phosphoribosylformylglycinamidine synthase subunit PurQ [Nitrospirota bacterium]|nr:phosphoribosylformylglycinamidine synthase subunit PurQ [Nitrospirota bacterium]
MTIGIVVFPGSNCDHDVEHVIGRVCGAKTRFLWHKETSLEGISAVVLPGGFSYGDYLRCGAIARVSPIMEEVRRFARQGRPVVGICNGFQVLVEAGILPGALVRNASLNFICRPVSLRVERTDSPYTTGYLERQVVNFPIAHADGNFQADAETLRRLEGEGRVAFRYCAPDGRVDPAANPNGSLGNIAGIFGTTRNVLGLMPHPERNAEGALGDASGRPFFAGLLNHLAEVTA